ncbi:MAG: LL-diaminopimelate aminotransferase [Candidatus Omnitrophica bacterium]|nr:LL-diaminopimelate aminotransferase [Candidatus Omnitrophota bacterium]
MELSERLKKLPPYLFVEIDREKRQAREAGRDIIDIGIGDPDQTPPQFVLDALSASLKEPGVHRYALDQGAPEFRNAIAEWYKTRFNVKLNPDTEILPLIGSKEGIAHIPLAFVNPGDYTLVPDPCYPPYKGGTIFAGGEPYLMPLLEANAFLPDLGAIPAAVLKKSKLIYINYPNNPTAAVADTAFYRRVVEFAAKNKLAIISDLAYSEIAYDAYKAPSMLETKDAKEVTIEFHSFSKTFNMTGWRVGWACGNAALISALGKVKSNIDSGVFTALQKTGAAALGAKTGHVEKMNKLYQERRDTLIDGLNSIGWKVPMPKATFYVWARLPKGNSSSIAFSQKLLKDADIVATPGVGFGKAGEGYIRMALTVQKERLQQAVERIKKIL